MYEVLRRVSGPGYWGTSCDDLLQTVIFHGSVAVTWW